MMKQSVDVVVGLVILASVPTAAIAAAHLLGEPASAEIQGQIEAREVDVASKVTGRVASLGVREGQHVEEGALLAELDCPELGAKLSQAEAALEAARAQHHKARKGARPEEIRRARRGWQGAEVAEKATKLTYDRIEEVYRRGATSAQKRDEVEAQWLVARNRTAAAKALYDMARAGARAEDVDAADALEQRASATVREVQIAVGETRVTAPAAGEVAVLVVDPGELVAAGYPIVSLVDLDDVWATFNVREDNLSRFGMGSRLSARVPALDNREVTLEVTFISPQAGFATSRATLASGDFDLRTFEVRARPTEPVSGLRPGMSVLVAPERS